MSTAGHGGKVIVPTQRQQRLQEVFRKRIDDEARRTLFSSRG
jgi:hypothetical protein